MEIKTLVLEVLTKLSVMKVSVELLQKEIRRSKAGVTDSTDSAANTQYAANIGIQIPLKNSQLQLGKMDVSVECKGLKSDVRGLNQFLKTDERQSVKEVILTDVSIIPAKWSDVVVGKHKKSL
jgi:hypothetical protein